MTMLIKMLAVVAVGTVLATSALAQSVRDIRGASPYITVDDLPWWWANASDNNTVDIAGPPPGQHKVKIELVDANHNVFPGQVVTLPSTVPGPTK